MKIGDLLKNKAMGEVDTSLGKLAVFDTSYGEHTKIVTEAPPLDESLPSEELVKRLLPHMVHLVDVLKDSKEKPAQPSLSKEQLSGLSDEDIETILDFFISHRKDLTHKADTEIYTNEQGERAAKLVYKELVHPRKDGEKAADYLRRLYLDAIKANKEQMQKMLEQVTGAAKFSQQATDQIKRSFEMGNSITKMMDDLRLPSRTVSQLQPREHLGPDIRSDAFLRNVAAIEQRRNLNKHQVEAQWAPFKSVNKRLDRLVEINAESSEFMVQMNQTQTTIAAELKTSGQEASEIGRHSLKIARWGFWLTIAVVVLTVIGIGFSIWDRQSAGIETQFIREQANEVNTGINGLIETIKDGQSNSAETFDLLRENHKTQGEQIRSILDAQAALIRKQEVDRERDRATIEELRIKLEALGERLNAGE